MKLAAIGRCIAHLRLQLPDTPTRLPSGGFSYTGRCCCGSATSVPTEREDVPQHAGQGGGAPAAHHAPGAKHVALSCSVCSRRHVPSRQQRAWPVLSVSLTYQERRQVEGEQVRGSEPAGGWALGAPWSLPCTRRDRAGTGTSRLVSQEPEAAGAWPAASHTHPRRTQRRAVIPPRGLPRSAERREN